MRPVEQVDVVVVGAGLAGLRATELLRGEGLDVRLVEGGRRVGGRVRTVTEPFVDGQYCETGAEWVDAVHWRMLRQLERFGLERLGAGEQWTTIRRWIHHGGRLLSPDDVRAESPSVVEELHEFDRIVEAAAAGVADPAQPQRHPDAAAVDSQSLADVAARAGLSELAHLFKWRDSQGEFAAEPAHVSLLFVAQQRALAAQEAGGEVVLSHRVRGGLSAVAAGMAVGLDDCLLLGEQLVAVEQDVEGVLIDTDRRTLGAAHVVLACSLPPLRRVEFRDAMPDALHVAVHGLGYGAITKTAVQWPRREWPKGYATTSGPAQRVYEPTVDQAGAAGILMSYCGGDGGREWARMTPDERIALAATEMRMMHGFTMAPLAATTRAWSAEPRFGGAYAVYMPGQVTAYWQVLREPWGRVHLAGEHVATWTGYMEGALESGETVAARVLASG